MLKIRLQRTGRKHETTFRVLLTDSKNSTKTGKFLEVLGSYDPRKDSKTMVLKTDRIKHWLSVGAQASGTVHNLLISAKVIEGKKVNVLPKKTYTAPVVEKVEMPTEPDMSAEAAPAKEEVAPEA